MQLLSCIDVSLHWPTLSLSLFCFHMTRIVTLFIVSLKEHEVSSLEEIFLYVKEQFEVCFISKSNFAVALCCYDFTLVTTVSFSYLVYLFAQLFSVNSFCLVNNNRKLI